MQVKQDLGQVQRTPTVFTFDLERHLLLEQTCGGDCSSSPAVDAAAFHDPFEEAMEPYLQMGLLVRCMTMQTSDCHRYMSPGLSPAEMWKTTMRSSEID